MREAKVAFQPSCALKVFKDRHPGTHHPPLSSAAAAPFTSRQPEKERKKERERMRVKEDRRGGSVLYKSTGVPTHLPPFPHLPSKTTRLR